MATTHPWAFRSTLKRGAFGWKSSAKAITRLSEALTEIEQVGRFDPALAAEGAVLLVEKLSPALEGVDSSSDALGAATHDAVRRLVPVISNAPASPTTRRKWLTRLEQACGDDGLSLIESLGEHWGPLCGPGEAGQALASEWADQLLPHVKAVMAERRSGAYAYSQSTVLCHSALFHAGRHEELLALLALDPKPFWQDQLWVARVLAARGQTDAAVQHIDGLHSPYAPAQTLAAFAERLLLDAGRSDEAYSRFAVAATSANIYIATYRSIAKRYPGMAPRRILDDLIRSTPGEAGKWFATAKTLKAFDLSLDLARRSPVDPRTLTRAARDQVASQPGFALEVALQALHWMARGHGHDITGAEVLEARRHARNAAERLGTAATLEARVAEAVQGSTPTAIQIQRILAT